MLRFVLQKMMNKKWMVLALLIGNILLISITGANAMYGEAVLQRTLMRNLSEYMTTSNNYPGLTMISCNVDYSRKQNMLDAAQTLRTMPETFGVEEAASAEHYYVEQSRAKADVERKNGMVKMITLGYMKELEEHIEIVAGRMYADQPGEEGVVEVIVSERGLSDMKLLLDETFTMQELKQEDGSLLRIKVVGVFRNTSDEDLYWVKSPSTMKSECLMSDENFENLFLDGTNKAHMYADLYMLLNYTQMRGSRAAHYAETSAYYTEYFDGITGCSYRDYFSRTVDTFLSSSQKVNVTLWVLQVPIFALLAAFIFMVSRQMLDMEQNEIAVLKSRGASRLQIITTYLLQSSVLALLGLAIGIPLGAYMVQVLGSANAFLEFVKRSALPVEVNGRVLLFCGIAAVFSIAAMVLPVFRHSRVTIVDHKQKKHRKSDAPLWQRIFLDVAILGVALYLLYNYNKQKDQLALQVLDGASLDPLLFIASSLFMIGAGLFALRILPVITFVLYRLFKKLWNPALYAAFLQVIRTRYRQGFIMVFLIMTIALGVFNAQAARTINTNREESIRYSIGADIVLKENWIQTYDSLMQGLTTSSAEADPEPIYTEPEFKRYEVLEGVESAAQVVNETNGCRVKIADGTLTGVQVMGINTKDFGETAWFKDGLLKSHFYDYLNAMATNSNAVLVSRNFETDYGMKLGDTIYYQNKYDHTARGIIYGFVDYWPGYSPTSDSGRTENYLIVANLNQLQAYWGVTPYEVWIKAEDSTQFIYDFVEENQIKLLTFTDTAAEIVELKNDPVFQGTNGILTVGFIVVLVLCTVGFLIYWILSIKSRSLQFGIYRAMGMSMREIITMLIVEQIFISGTSIATGALVGWLTSKLYMPLIQVAYSAGDNTLPLRLVSEQSDMIRLVVIIGAMILVCMLILGWLISKMKIAQALKLGED